MTIQWYPGHMAKAKRLMQENIALIDVIVELRDARIPLSSENPLLKEMAPHKAKVIAFTKSDLADDALTTKWETYFQSQGQVCLFVDATAPISKNKLIAAIEQAGKPKREKDAKRGIKNRPLKVMIVGIPNVGKSTLINQLAKRKMAPVADRPGVTKTVSWIPIGKQLFLMDTPGVLWPKFDDQTIGMKLALTNAIKEQILPLEDIVRYAYDYMKNQYPKRLDQRYDVMVEYMDADGFFYHLAKSKGMLTKEGKADMMRVFKFFLLEIKHHKLGKITWEQPNGSL